MHERQSIVLAPTNASGEARVWYKLVAFTGASLGVLSCGLVLYFVVKAGGDQKSMIGGVIVVGVPVLFLSLLGSILSVIALRIGKAVFGRPPMVAVGGLLFSVGSLLVLLIRSALY